jgi:carbonic anhydrase/acetyltransferase-like protein (isoleucine patch superfamily)
VDAQAAFPAAHTVLSCLETVMAIYQLEQRIPALDPSAFVFESAVVVGTVVLGPGVNVWPFASLRGDNEPITVGEGSNVQDGCVLHTDPGCPLTIGRYVTVGHQAMLHGCTVGDGSLIGIQAIVLNRAVIGRNCLIGAGSVVTEGKVIPDNSLAIGAPARVIRELTAEEIERFAANARGYVERGALYAGRLKRIA